MNQYLSTLRELFERYKQGTITVAEHQQLMELVRMPENEGWVKELFAEEMAQLELEEEYKTDLLGSGKADDIFASIMERGRQAPVIPLKTIRPRRRILSIAAAAAVLLILAGAGLRFFTRTPTEKSVPVNKGIAVVKNDFPPGAKTAVLTLANGRQIALDSTAKGTITRQGNIAVTNANGQLAYAAVGAGRTEVVYNTLTTQRGNQYQLVLPDGSRVWLNAASSVRFPTAFTGNERVVNITGEAYFEITKDAAHPFRVEANGSSVLVLGTSFNINAYHPAVTTTLLEGAVKLVYKEQQQLLQPGQQGLINDHHISVKQANLAKAVAWKEGEFYFSHDAISEIAEQVSRWYDVDVELKGSIPARTFSGNISRHVKLSEMLNMLEFVTKAKFEVKGRKLTIQF